jgi:hypothetical protein
VQDVLLAYASAVAAGQVPNGAELLRRHPELASLRDHAALDGVPEAERAAWQQLGADVTTLLKKVTNAGPSSP